LGTVEYAVEAVRKGYTLYLTPSAGARTGLVCDYVFDDRYGEDREDEDALLIETFIAVGCSSSADRVVQALLPYALRHGVQPKLAGATVRLVFDDTGKLQAVTA
ncbi:MAG: ATP-binding protein, partial [Cobetia sp.]